MGNGIATTDHAVRLLDGLFDGRGDESTRAYLRQLLHQAHEVLPELEIDARVVKLGERVLIRSESVSFEAALAEAARLHGEARLRQTRDALRIYDAGPYLPGPRRRVGAAEIAAE